MYFSIEAVQTQLMGKPRDISDKDYRRRVFQGIIDADPLLHGRSVLDLYEVDKIEPGESLLHYPVGTQPPARRILAGDTVLNGLSVVWYATSLVKTLAGKPAQCGTNFRQPGEKYCERICTLPPHDRDTPHEDKDGPKRSKAYITTIEPALCEDEGCPQFGTPHVCITRVESSQEMEMRRLRAFVVLCEEKLDQRLQGQYTNEQILGMLLKDARNLMLKYSWGTRKVAEEKTVSEEVTISSVWQHRNGEAYTVRLLTNTASANPAYVPTVVYEGARNGKFWSRPLADWHRSFTRI